MTAPRQRTLGGAAELEGIGLHTGQSARIRLLPAEPDRGLRFRRIDLEGCPEVPARVRWVAGADRGTTLERGGARVQTVEHVLSALAGMGVDNATIELDGPEPPAADGSAEPFVRLIEEAGVVELEEDAEVFSVRGAFVVEEGTSRYSVEPAPALELAASIRFDHPMIGSQSYTLCADAARYREGVARARTFGFVRELEGLYARGLARGGNLDNAVVLTDDGLYEGIELRFEDEFARHKVLDLLGDLALVGRRIRGRITADRPSHRGNIALAKRLAKMAENAGGGKTARDIEQILKNLPHRYPLLLVDRILEFEDKKRIVGLKNVTINEPFFVGHFPGHPIMPGVLIIEAMAQVGGLLMMEAIENPEEKLVYFMSLDKVKWRRPVTPGDQIRFEVEVLQIRGQTARMRGVGIVDEQIVAEAEMMARVVDK